MANQTTSGKAVKRGGSPWRRWIPGLFIGVLVLISIIILFDKIPEEHRKINSPKGEVVFMLHAKFEMSWEWRTKFIVDGLYQNFLNY